MIASAILRESISCTAMSSEDLAPWMKSMIVGRAELDRAETYVDLAVGEALH